MADDIVKVKLVVAALAPPTRKQRGKMAPDSVGTVKGPNQGGGRF